MSTDAAFGYEARVRDRFPSIRAGVVYATLVSNGPSPPALLAHARTVQGLARERLKSGPPLAELLSIRAWRDVFHACGVKPTRHRVAIEALLRRLDKGGDIPSINCAVDIGNCVAITHTLPVAVFDRAALVGALRVQFATGEERFMELGADEATAPDPGEIVFVDESGVVAARRWCWRQSQSSAAGPATTDVLFVAEGHHESADRDVRQACDELMDLLARFQPNSSTSTTVINRDG